MANVTVGGMTVCGECGARVPDVPTPGHAYVPAAPGCWAAFSGVQARELQRFGRTRARGTVVDTYMAQHPGDGHGDPRAARSPIVHLLGLCGRLDHGLGDEVVGRLLQRAAAPLRQSLRTPLNPRTHPGTVTVVDLIAVLDGGADADAYLAAARRWSQAVWQTWSHEHARIRAMYRQAWPDDR